MESASPQMIVTVDQGICVGAEYCMQVATETLRLAADGVAELHDGSGGPAPVPAAQLPAVREAAAGCPSGAIRLEPAPSS